MISLFIIVYISILVIGQREAAALISETCYTSDCHFTN